MGSNFVVLKLLVLAIVLAKILGIVWGFHREVMRGLLIVCAAALVIFLIGSVGSTDYHDAKELEKTICARADAPDWCQHRND